MTTSGAKILANRGMRGKQLGTKFHWDFQHTKEIQKNAN